MKAKYGGTDVPDDKRLRQLEDENAKLKKPFAYQMLEASAPRELPTKKVWPVGASGLHLRRGGPEDDPLQVPPPA